MKEWHAQVTSHQLRQQKEVEKQAAAEESKKRELAAKREVTPLGSPSVSLMSPHLSRLWHSVSPCVDASRFTASNGPEGGA